MQIPHFDTHSRIITSKQGISDKHTLFEGTGFKFKYKLNPIIMGNLGEIGWYLKLETLNEQRIGNKSYLAQITANVKIYLS